MKRGDIKYHLEMDRNRSYLYKVKLLILYEKQYHDNWRVKYIKKVFDFMNKKNEDMVDMEEVIHIDDLFDNIEDAVAEIVNSTYGMKPRKIIMRLFK